ncbi:MAG: tetratricopeptide repeat protein [Deltaproteobacteria bacterium]|nr:tetratricopeptide repeat protein [Deltaproteobacteria bacterium]
MSLIEKALNKASKEITPNAPEQPLNDIDPTSIVPVPQRGSSFPLLKIGSIVFTAVVALSLVLFFFTFHTLRPSPSNEVSPQTDQIYTPVLSQTDTASALTSEPPESRTKSTGTLPAEDLKAKPGPLENAPTPAPPSADRSELTMKAPEPKTSPPPSGARSPASAKQPPIQQTQTLAKKAYVYAETGNFLSAIRCYDEILSKEPRNFEALLNRGIIRQKINDLPGAEQDLLQALHLHSDDKILLNALGVLYIATGREAPAKDLFEKAGDTTSLINLALLYWERQDWDNVVAALRDAERKDPHNPCVPYYLGLHFRQRGDHVSARKEFNKALSLAQKKGRTDVIRNIESLPGAP